MRWKIFQWMKFLFRHSSNSRKLSQQKFHDELACVFTAHFARKNTHWNQQQLTAAFWPIGTVQIIHIVAYPIRKKSRFWLFCMWSVKGLYHTLLLKTDHKDKGRGHDCRLSCYLLPHYSVLTQEKSWSHQCSVTNRGKSDKPRLIYMCAILKP